MWAAVVEAEPAPRRTCPDDAALDQGLAGFGDAADLKTPWLHGHSGGVARLTRAAADGAGVDATLVHRAVFHPDATWNHRNPDRLGGVHDGRDAILAFIEESGRLTAGTLRALPETVMADGEGHVAVVTGVSGSRPDGRAFDDRQVLVFTLDAERVRAVDQYIGDPDAVTAFWA